MLTTNNFFRALQSREVTGEMSKTCYLCITANFAPFLEILIEHFFNGDAFSKYDDIKANSNKKSAEINGLEMLKKNMVKWAKNSEKGLKGNPKSLLKNQFYQKLIDKSTELTTEQKIETLDLQNFKENVLLIFKLEGHTKEIDDLILNRKYKTLGNRIIYVTDNTDTLLIRRSKEIDEKNKMRS